jgi:hypothetical protein
VLRLTDVAAALGQDLHSRPEGGLDAVLSLLREAPAAA